MSAKRKTYIKKNKNDAPHKSIKGKMAEILELPREIIQNVPKIIMVGVNDLIIENYKGIIEYDSNRIRVNTGSGIVRITGFKLSIKGITSEDIMIDGEINSLEFLK